MGFSRSIPALVAVLLLAACGREPSEADIEAAFARDLAESSRVFETLGAGGLGDAFRTTLHGVEKHGCTETGTGSYRCEVTVDIELPLVGRQTRTTEVRLVERKDGWALVQE